MSTVGNLSVDLLFPPLYKMNAPYTALPWLAGFLKANGVDGLRIRDLNIDYLHHLMDDTTLRSVEEGLRRRSADFSERGAMDGLGWEGVEREHLDHALSLIPLLRRSLPETLALFRLHRSNEHVRSLPRDRAVREAAQVEVMFDLLGEVYTAWFFPWRIENLLTRREVYFVSDRWGRLEVNNVPWRDHMASLRHPRNPFLSWCEQVVIPDLEERAPAVIGLSLMFREQFLCVFTLADLIRERLPSAHICIGGALVSDFEHYLYSSPTLRDAVMQRADSLVMGPGEVPFFRLLERLAAGDSVDDVPNVLTRRNIESPRRLVTVVPTGPDGRVARPGTPRRFQSLPGSPEAAPDHVRSNATSFDPAGRESPLVLRHATPIFFDGDMERYLYRTPEIAISYLASHGCYWNRCTFCKYRDQVHRYTPVPIDQVVGDLVRLSRTLGTRTFHFNDEALSPSFCKKFSERLLADGLNLRWSGNTRFDPGFSRELLAQLKASGCQYLCFGLESASPRILELLDKGTSLETIEETMANCRAVGLPINLYFFFAFPGETREDMLLTLDFLRRHHGTYVDTSVGQFSLYHSTEVFQEPGRFGIRVDYGDVEEPDVIRWNYDYVVTDPRALQREEAVAFYLARHREVFGELGPCFSTDGSL